MRLRCRLAEAEIASAGEPRPDGPDTNTLGSDNLRAYLLRIAACYLLHAKRGEQPVDAVARFHLGNGARVERLNWRGDTSAKGLRESFGIMVNYRYEPSSIEANHEAFVTDHLVVATKAVTELVEPPKRR